MQMADVSLSNSASVTGTYGMSPLTLESNFVITQIVDGLSIKKEVDKQKWVTGELTYTITVENNADNSYEGPILTDVLDPSLVNLVNNSVTVNGVIRQYDYEESTGKLAINLDTISKGETSVITFRVQRKN